jgi:hypothetical protein
VFNTRNYIEGRITKDLIMSYVSEEDIFQRYLGIRPKLSVKYINPFRDEKLPNSCFYVTPSGNWRFKDFTGFCNWGCFDVVMYCERLSFKNALHKIAMDFGIVKYHTLTSSPTINPSKSIVKAKVNTKPLLQITSKAFTSIEYEWWRCFGIRPQTLHEYNVKSVSHVWLNRRIVSQSNRKQPIFAYEFDKGVYKIYSPLRTEFKWLSNCCSHHYQGYDQLSWIGDTLIITKSLKDVMVLREMGYDSIAPHTEHARIPWEFMEKLRRRFKRIVVFFDNDSAGIEGAKNLASYHNIESIIIPKSYNIKDISDYVKSNNLEKGKVLMHKILG